SNGALTPQATFDASMDAIAGALSTTGAQGVMANIPYVTDIPFFTTVPYNAVPLDATTAAAVNGGYAAYNGGIQAALAALDGTGLFTAEEAAARTISFSEGQNAVVIEDENLTDLGAINPAFAALPKYRQATEDDLVVLLAASFIGTLADPNNPASVNGVGVPLADNWVLTKTEIDEITNMIDHINGKISSMATQLGYAHFDANDMFQQIFRGDITYNSFNPNASLVFGGMMSLDGVHPTSRGYAVIANEFMKAIDETYGSNFEASGNLVDIGDYPTNYSPLLQ
ncbi:MAG: G-D-S-L family lipolytic protein, partial [Flavobacteriaceae bacterium]